jgi:hypothetical protein
MRASNIKSDVRYEQRDDSRFGIVNWGIYNDYPQRILEIAAASGTATVCFEKYAKFIEGDGFVDQTFWKTYDQLHAELQGWEPLHFI